MASLPPHLALLTVLAGVACAPPSADAAATGFAGSDRAEVRLLTGSDGVRAGQAFQAGLQFRLGDGWHAYWRTPGDAGVAPRFDWSGSTNVRAVRVDWPAPQRLEISGLQNAVYSGGFVLPLTIERLDANAGANLAVAIDYAICGKICVPVHADLSMNVPAGNGSPSVEAPALDAARALVPGSAPRSGFAVDAIRTEAAGNGRKLSLAARSRGEPFHHPDLFVESASPGLPPAPDIVLGPDGMTADLSVNLPADAGQHVALTLTDDGRAAQIPVDLSDGGGAERLPNLLAMMAIGLLGGLILNVMPCVLPVLAIKLSSVLRHADGRRSDIRLGFLTTAAGIVATFLVLAVALVGLKAAGAQVGWGIQFQQPWFLATLAAMTVLFAASLFDWLPIGLPPLPGRMLEPVGQRAHVRSFLAGVASTLLATPCSAPFVGTAIGFALARGSFDIVAVFLSLGIGMALPFLFVAAVPGIAAFLPKPGVWMIHVRHASGVLLLGTAAWLLWLLSADLGRAATGWVGLLLAGLLAVRFLVARRPAVGTSGTIATAALAAGVVIVPVIAPSPRDQARSADWAAFDPASIDDAVTAGRTVLVDVTATWCLTCKLNDLSTLDREAVRARLSNAGTLLMRADWSHTDPTIAGYLRRYGRFGIPFDVVYGPGHPSGTPLPELLTPNLLEAALDDARAPPRTRSMP